jgi:TonB family protein
MKHIPSCPASFLSPVGPWTGGLLCLLALAMAGCASSPPATESEDPVPVSAAPLSFQEVPVPDGDWRPHRLARCLPDTNVSVTVERYLGICSEYFREGSGSDGMIEMELGLQEGYRHSLMLLTLGQLYLMAGQGDPDLLPVEGPAADVGDWNRNRTRLLGRAGDLLQEAAETRRDDAAVDYLLADVARARGDQDQADVLLASGMEKCTAGRSFAILWQYQQLNNYAPKYLGGASPVYPQAALKQGVEGDVVLDVLLSPAGEVRQVVAVDSPAETLTEAASASLRKGRFEAARMGKYPIWSWLRVTTAFNLEDRS